MGKLDLTAQQTRRGKYTVSLPVIVDKNNTTVIAALPGAEEDNIGIQILDWLIFRHPTEGLKILNKEDGKEYLRIDKGHIRMNIPEFSTLKEALDDNDLPKNAPFRVKHKLYIK